MLSSNQFVCATLLYLKSQYDWLGMSTSSDKYPILGEDLSERATAQVYD